MGMFRTAEPLARRPAAGARGRSLRGAATPLHTFSPDGRIVREACACSTTVAAASESGATGPLSLVEHAHRLAVTVPGRGAPPRARSHDLPPVA
jgi:hypothetical protein